MFKLIFAPLYFFLPGILSNTAATLTWKYTFLSRFRQRVDFGLELRGQALFGKTKTWRGLIVGTLTGIIIISIQTLLYNNLEIFKNFSLINYSKENVLLIGASMGLGAMIGDLGKSFIKRRMNIDSSKPWFPYDQIDQSFGIILFILPFGLIDIKYIISFFIVYNLFRIVEYYLFDNTVGKLKKRSY